MAPHHAPITFLPVDLLIYIIDRVPEPSDRKSIRLVSRAFHRAECLQRRDLNVIRREALGILIRCYGAIESLDLSACAGLDDACLSAALGSGAAPGLRMVNLSRASGVRWRGLAAMVRGCPWLESVDLSHCVGVGDREVAVLAMLAGLKELRLDKCLGVSDVGLAKVAVGCPGLEKLRIKWCLEISDLGIKLLANKCQNLKFLDISYLLVTNKSLHSISTLGRLEVLKMVGCYYITDDGLNYLKNEKNCNTLLSVDVSRCHNVSAFGLVSIIEGHKSLRKLKASDCYVVSVKLLESITSFNCAFFLNVLSLKMKDLPPNCLSKLGILKNGFHTLKLDGSEVSEPRLKIIGANCKGLTKIGLGKCKGVTDENFSELVSNCADLKTIDLTCCHDVTDDSLIAIANSCKKLESLLLESCSLITDEGLVYIGICCPNLQEVDLTDCDLDDSALESLSRCSELTKVKLGLCAGITDDGLDYIANCEKLQELDLYRCTGIGDEGLAALAYGCKKIRKLNLCYCTRISDQGMKYVSCLPELKDLELRGLTQVTSLGIVAIAFGCKNLTELDMKRCSAVDDLGFLGLARYAINLRQINISYCNISEQVLIRLLWNLRCLQDVKLVHLTQVRKEAFMLALRSCLDKLKKLKLPSNLKDAIAPALIQILQDKGCRIRWVDKPIPFFMKDSPPSSPDP